jgi:phosphohistidine phosphatase
MAPQPTSAVYVHLVHHADAVGPLVDPMRPLSAHGRRQAEALAAGAAARGVRPDVIWHSGKLRARQTAEPFLRSCNALAVFSATRGLQPGDPPQWIADALAGDDRAIMMVGHMPHLARLLRLLVTGDADAAGPEFPLHGMVEVRREENGAWALVPPPMV